MYFFPLKEMKPYLNQCPSPWVITMITVILRIGMIPSVRTLKHYKTSLGMGTNSGDGTVSWL